MNNNKFQRLLTERKQSLIATLDTESNATATVELDQSKVGRLSRMDALQAQAISKETQRRHKLEITRIDAALKRIEEDEYGYCLECGEEIAEKRLEIDPSATLCIQCAEQGE